MGDEIRPKLGELTAEEIDRIAGTLEDGIGPYERWIEVQECRTRRDYARIAMRIAEDRYSAGSSAVRVALIILLRHGVQAAIDFMADLRHHEDC